MNELYTKIGQQQVALDNLNAQYDSLLLVFSKVAAGEIANDRVAVDLAARSWSIVPEPLLKEVKDATANTII